MWVGVGVGVVALGVASTLAFRRIAREVGKAKGKTPQEDHSILGISSWNKVFKIPFPGREPGKTTVLLSADHYDAQNDRMILFRWPEGARVRVRRFRDTETKVEKGTPAIRKLGVYRTARGDDYYLQLLKPGKYLVEVVDAKGDVLLWSEGFQGPSKPKDIPMRWTLETIPAGA